jgi:hypothetical protein
MAAQEAFIAHWNSLTPEQQAAEQEAGTVATVKRYFEP